MDGSDNSEDRDGYQSLTSNIDRILQSPHYDVVWRKTDEDITQHSGDVADDLGVEMPDVVDNDGTVPTDPTLTDGQLDAITGDSVTTSTQSFTLDGKTVNNDLDGDELVNAADWDERFGSTDTSPSENHNDAVAEAKDARRATDQATGAGGPSASDTQSTTPSNNGGDDGTDSNTGESTDSSVDEGGESSTDDGALGGDLPDGLLEGTAGAHAAEKGSRIAEAGLDLAAGY